MTQCLSLTLELKTGEYEYNPEKYPNTHIIAGGNPSNPTWPRYMSFKRRVCRKYFSLIRQYVEYFNLIGCPGSYMEGKYFEFSDGTVMAFTWRAWGDFMQAIVGKREGYMNYQW